MSDDALQPPEGLRTYAEVVGGVLDHLTRGGIITDTEPGGIARTLVEAMAREMAEAYALLNQVYRAAFIDTAEGAALDHLVALLDVARIDGHAAVGVVVFRRDPRVAGHIAIPRGTRLLLIATGKQVEYQTVDDERLPSGRQDASVQVLCPITGDAAKVVFDGKDVRVRLVDPIAGIGAVELTEPTRERGHRESDVQLRERVKGLLDASGGGTAKAIEHAVLAVEGVEAVRLREAGDDGGRPLNPGELELVVDLAAGKTLADTGLYQAIESAAIAAKGPGVHLRLAGVCSRRLRLKLHLLPTSSTVDADLRATIEQGVSAAVKTLVDGLAVGESLSWNRVVAAVLAVAGVADLGPGNWMSLDQEEWREPKGSIAIESLDRLALAAADLEIQVDDQESVLVNLSAILPAGTAPSRVTQLANTLTQALGNHLGTVSASSTPSLSHAAICVALNRDLAMAERLSPSDVTVEVFTLADQGIVHLTAAGCFTTWTPGASQVLRLSHDAPRLTVAGAT